MSIYQELQDEVNARVNNQVILDKLVTELIFSEKRAIDVAVGRARPINSPYEYANRLKRYVAEKIALHRKFRYESQSYVAECDWKWHDLQKQRLRDIRAGIKAELTSY